MSETIYVVSKMPFVFFNSFITLAKIALSMSILVAVFAKSFIHAEDYMRHLAFADSPSDIW